MLSSWLSHVLHTGLLHLLKNSFIIICTFGSSQTQTLHSIRLPSPNTDYDMITTKLQQLTSKQVWGSAETRLGPFFQNWLHLFHFRTELEHFFKPGLGWIG